MEKRNSRGGGGAQPRDLGARRGPGRQPGARGGYLNTYHQPEVTIKDLKKILRAPVLIQAAEQLGPERFILFWRHIDTLQDDSAWLRLPAYSRLERYIRNKIIFNLYQAGLLPAEIREQLKENNISLSLRAIHDILHNHTRDHEQ